MVHWSKIWKKVMAQMAIVLASIQVAPFILPSDTTVLKSFLIPVAILIVAFLLLAWEEQEN